MQKKLKQIWEFLSQISGVVATFGILIYSANYLFHKMMELSHTNILAFTLLVVGSIGSITFIVYLAKEKISNFIISLKKETLRETLTHPNSTDILFDFDKVLPTEKFFNIAKELSLQEGLAWSKDAKISTFNFYIHKQDEKVELRIQIFLFSEWKNETMDVYYPSLSTSYEKITYSQTELHKYFFEFPNWREAVSKAYDKISSKTTSGFDLQISNDGNYFTMNFRFMTGKVKEVFSFTFDGKTLLCNHDKSSVII